MAGFAAKTFMYTIIAAGFGLWLLGLLIGLHRWWVLGEVSEA